MKVEYSRRALADIDEIIARTRRLYGDRVGLALEARIRAVIERISKDPLSAPELEQRPGIHVVALVRYPFKIFYRLLEDRVRIQHIRHSSRRPWEGGE